MNRSIVLGAIFLCAGCAHTSSTPKPQTDQLVDNILLGDSQQPICARDEVSTCKVTTRTPGARARDRCECVPLNAFDADPTRN